MTQPNVDFRSELAGQAAALRSLAQRLVSRDDAEDLTHDAMVTALSQTTPPRRVRPWLRMVLRNEARAQHRSTVRRQAREQRASSCDEAMTPESWAEHAQVAAAVQAALVELDPAYRRVLEARFYDDRTAADIARSEGCPAGTVRWRVQEGLRRMRSSLDARFEGRDAWRDRMAAFAGAPLTLVGPTPGEPHMISSSLFTKLTLGTLVAAASVALVATSQRPAVAAEQPTTRPHMAAVTSASEPARPAPSRIEPPAAAPPAVPVAAAPEDPDEPGCAPCATHDGMGCEQDPDEGLAHVPSDVDASTPVEMADEGLLPKRAEGEAPVRTIVACSDYECPFCDRARPTLDQVLDEFPDVELAWMHAPMDFHPGASVAARAAVAAQAQGQFWAMHDLLFDRPEAHGEDDVRGLARELGLDMARFDRDFTSEATAQLVEAQRASCTAAGARGTPSFFVGDEVMVGAQGIDAFRKLLE